jgi:hypothetical protein
MTSSTSSSDRAARVLAALLPVALLGGLFAWAWSRTEAVPTERLLAYRALVDEKRPEVVLIGDSQLQLGVEAEPLEAALGVPVAKLAVSGSPLPVWYAALENVVYRRGHAPKLIVVVAGLARMLETSGAGTIETGRLAEFAGDDEPVLAAKVLGGSGANLRWLRLQRQRVDVRDTLLAAVKGSGVRLFFGGSADEATARAHAASTAVFDRAGAIDMALDRKVIPIVQVEAGNTAAVASTVADSLLPDVLALAAANGSRVVVVRHPHNPGTTNWDVVPLDVQAEVITLLNAHGAGYVDGDSLGTWSRGDFRDPWHLGPAAGRRFTGALAEKLVALGALDAEPLDPNRLPVAPPVITRSGTPPALDVRETVKEGGCQVVLRAAGVPPLGDVLTEAAGFPKASPLEVLGEGVLLRGHAPWSELQGGCVGAFVHGRGPVFVSPRRAGESLSLRWVEDVPIRTPAGESVYWVLPGTALDFEFPEAVDTAGPTVRFGVLAASFGGSAPAVLRTPGGADVPLAGESEAVRGAVSVPAPRGAWRVSVASPADGPWLLVKAARLDLDEASYDLVTPGRTLVARQVGFLDGSRGGGPVVEGEPPALAVSRPPTARAPVLDPAPAEAGLGSSALRVSAMLARCSPLVARGPAGPLRSVASCGDLAADTFCRTGSGVRFMAEVPEQVTLGLDPHRGCNGDRTWWVYPGDRLRSEASAKAASSFRVPPTRLTWSGRSVGAGEAPVTLTLLVDDTPLLARSLTPAELDGEEHSVSLPAISAGKHAYVVVVESSAGSPYTLLTDLRISNADRVRALTSVDGEAEDSPPE